MKILLVVAILFSVNCFARKVVYVHPISGEIYMVELKQGGKLNAGNILHDEKNGPIPANVMAQYNASKNTRDSARSTKLSERQTRRAALKNINWANMTVTQLKAIVRKLVQEKEL